ncbi:Cytochrome b [Hyphomicrobiales bacterium]|nr:Cytochrome b [Hyphomicrobiales bacterium]CAH1699700.1 Cytochrome b [Hyphomicrobiales bacterium]CAI0343431.1 superoxide oxidase [Hyphomicrobiales bacterium]
MPKETPSAGYSAPARTLHWITAIAVFVMIPVGVTMSYRGNVLNLWDGLTNGLYSGHKLLGFLLLWLTAGRLAYRFLHGAPPDEPTLEWWQRAGSHLVHWLLYGLLLVVPLLGWIGVSLFPALTIFDLFSLPALTKPDEAAAQRVLGIHGKLALTLGALAILHIAAALYHRFIRKDGVLRRMWPGAG